MTGERLDLEAKMAAFAKTFPSLRPAPGVAVWHAMALDRWAAKAAVSHGELVTARFVLAVWDAGTEWQCGRFDLMDALRVWDPGHRRAFLSWVVDPWWP